MYFIVRAVFVRIKLIDDDNRVERFALAVIWQREILQSSGITAMTQGRQQLLLAVVL